MKYTKKICLIACGALLSCIPFMKANAANCGAGYYSYLYKQCYDCPDGCYCTGVTDAPWHGHVFNTVSGWCKTKPSGDKKYVKTLGLDFCPSDFPSSPKNAKSEEECFKTCNNDANVKIYNKKYSCKAGYYLPANATSDKSCKECPKDGKSYCPGVQARTLQCNDSDTYGLSTCTGGKVPNDARTNCVSASEKCPGNKILKNNTCKECDIGTAPNADHTECVKDEKSVPAGKYLPKGANTPADCKQATKDASYYCPGGNYIPSGTIEQGLFKCPGNERTNKDKTACVQSIGKTKMETCWLLVDNPEKFQECVLD